MLRYRVYDSTPVDDWTNEVEVDHMSLPHVPFRRPRASIDHEVEVEKRWSSPIQAVS